jgi:orotidine 5'-phosphate decarboxylase subfamily 2
VIEPFGARLRTALDDRGPLCVGIDPHAALLDAWGLPDDAAGLERFSLTVVDALADRVAVLKPQSAFFERHGSRGIAVLERTIATARAGGALVLLDVKRGDIGSTMQAYAEAYCDRRSPLFSDAVTASPYHGFGSLRPLIDTALAHGAGVFVLALTSNPEGAQVQSARTSCGRTVAGSVLAGIARCNVDVQPLGSVGAVVGATIGGTDEDLDVNGPLLAPGLGAQGATAADLRRVFGAALRNVVPTVSREVLQAGPSVGGLRDAAGRAREAYAAALQPPR